MKVSKLQDINDLLISLAASGLTVAQTDYLESVFLANDCWYQFL